MTAGYEVVAVRFATRAVPASQVFLNHHVYGEPDRELGMDYFFWVLRGAERTVVVDTGFTPGVARARGRTMLCPPAEALEHLGIDPGAVDTVVITHGHYDHTGNVGLFPRAQIVMSGRELDFWQGPLAGRVQFSHLVEHDDLAALVRLQEDGRLTRVSGVQQVAPGVVVREVGGHTPGQLIVEVQGARRPVLLAADAVHYYEELSADRPFAVVADLERMYQAFDTIRSLAAASGSVVVPGHDPLVLTRFPALDPARAGFAVRLD